MGITVQMLYRKYCKDASIGKNRGMDAEMKEKLCVGDEKMEEDLARDK